MKDQTQNSYFTLPENPPGTFRLTKIQVWWNVITFIILNVKSHIGLIFTFSWLGLIKSAFPLDRETTNIYRFEAHVRDAAMPEWECLSSVEIHVMDTNDNAPIWSQASFSASLAEDTPVGKHLRNFNGCPAITVNVLRFFQLWTLNNSYLLLQVPLPPKSMRRIGMLEITEKLSTLY